MAVWGVFQKLVGNNDSLQPCETEKHLKNAQHGESWGRSQHVPLEFEATVGTDTDPHTNLSHEVTISAVNGRVQICHQKHEYMDPSCLVWSVQAGGGGLMVWGICSTNIRPFNIDQKSFECCNLSDYCPPVCPFMTTIYPGCSYTVRTVTWSLSSRLNPPSLQKKGQILLGWWILWNFQRQTNG